MDSKDPEAKQLSAAIDKLDLEAELLFDLEKSSKALDETFAKLAEIETKVFAIVNKELDEKDDDDNYKMSATSAALIFSKLSDSILKKHKSKLETIQLINGVRNNGDIEISEDINDGSDTDLTDLDMKGAMKALTQYFKKNNHHKKKTYSRKKPT